MFSFKLSVVLCVEREPYRPLSRNRIKEFGSKSVVARAVDTDINVLRTPHHLISVDFHGRNQSSVMLSALPSSKPTVTSAAN